MNKRKIIIATTKTWNLRNAAKLIDERRDFDITIVNRKEDLEDLNLDKIEPEWIFFPHWSWIISEKIINNFKCVIFHTSKLPFGRGGSPLQNQIIRGIYLTEVCAVRAIKEVDAGPIYLRKKVSLANGNIDEILITISDLIFTMINKMLDSKLIPTEQSGNATYFKRRKSTESELSMDISDSRKVYDFIRMLDGEGYPPAFLSYGGNKIELTNARLKSDGSIEGKFKIFKIEEPS